MRFGACVGRCRFAFEVLAVFGATKGEFDMAELNTTSAPEREGIDFDSAVDAAVNLLLQNPRQRTLLYWTLERCGGSLATREELETEMVELPAYRGGGIPPYFIAQWLVDAHALDFFELDAQGVPIDRDALAAEGRSEDEIDDVIVGYGYTTNEVGIAAINRLDPAKRMVELVSEKPEMREQLLEILAYLKERHSLGDIAHHIKSTFGISERDFAEEAVNPVALVTKLADAGAIAFGDHGWQATAEGRRFLLETQSR